MDNAFAKFREDKNLTITAAAALCGVNKSTFLRWETGASKPDIGSVRELAKRMRVSREKLRPDIFGAMQ